MIIIHPHLSAKERLLLGRKYLSTLEEYTYCLDGRNSKSVNKLRFQKFTQKHEQEEKYLNLSLLPPCRNIFHPVHPSNKSSCLLDETCRYCNSARATSSRLRMKCNCQRHLGKWTKLLLLFITSIKALMMKLTMKILMNQNLDGKAQETIVTLNKGFWKFVGRKSEAFLNLIKHFQRLYDYNTAISYFFFSTNILETPILAVWFFLTLEESSAVNF